VATDLTIEQMKRLVKDHFEDFVNRRNASVIRKNMSPDFYDHDGPGGRPTGVDGDEQMMLSMYKAMPDLRLTIEDVVAEGGKVVCRNIWRWSDPASGKPMQFQASCCGVLRETKSPSAGPP
jgi:predicted ester cyclase